MSLQRLSAWGGSFLIADTTVRTGLDYYAFVVQEDTVIATLSGKNSAGISETFLTTQGIGTEVLKAGAMFCVPLGAKYTNITLTSGSIIVY